MRIIVRILCTACIFLYAAAVVTPNCEGSVPCVINSTAEDADYDNNHEFRTAVGSYLKDNTISVAWSIRIRQKVGCLETLTVVFGSSKDNVTTPLVSMCAPQSNGECLPRRGAVLTDFQISCCELPFEDRPAQCSSDPSQGLPMDVYQCMQLISSTDEQGRTHAVLSFMAPFQSDLSNDGIVEVCLNASEPDAQQRSMLYCITFKVERCSTCAKRGQGLAVLARSFGTHWTQIYSSNPEISGNPDDIVEGQLIRLGSLYRVTSGDTLMAIALKFGVSVNQIFFWNKHLVPIPHKDDGLNSAGMSRDLPVGLELCILPKTCLSSFGSNQPVNFLSETSSEGGWFADPVQITADEFSIGAPEGGLPDW